MLHPLHFSRPILGGMGECNGDTITKRDGIARINIPLNYTRPIVTASIGIPVAKEEKVGEENNENEEGSSEAPDFYNHRAFLSRVSRDEKLGRVLTSSFLLVYSTLPPAYR